MDLLLDPVTHDLVFVNGQATVTQTQSEIVTQRLKITLYTFLGEWFLDTSVGVPYFQQIFGKVRSKSAIDVIFQNIIANDEGVVEIREFSSDLSTGDRGYTMTFKVRCKDDTITDNITITVGL
ncbi:putative tail lysozyme [Pseudomonas phage phiK7A1]|uniref:Putative tail lysozyme n=1 Tax=Pseudomonas phage phiK7A1 TaxID=2759194 RepID=A0A7H0XFT3_9CAUD|nr:putative tail lysozyme [Pseudomonas phage phiK7A1]